MNRVSLDRAEELLSYDPSTGFVTRLKTVASRARAGQRAGSLNFQGYVVLQVDGKKFMLHRIIWLLAYGEWPDGEVDHINGDRSDNRLENLRLASRAENGRNMRPRGGTAGLKGVYWHKRARKWCAQIVKDDVNHYLGLHDEPEDAHAAYCEAAKRLHGEFARTA